MEFIAEYFDGRGGNRFVKQTHLADHVAVEVKRHRCPMRFERPIDALAMVLDGVVIDPFRPASFVHKTRQSIEDNRACDANRHAPGVNPPSLALVFVMRKQGLGDVVAIGF